jgi:hypothetical protein
LLVFLAGGSGLLLVVLIDDLSAWVVPAAYALPPLLAVCLILAVRLARLGTASIPAFALMLGAAWVMGGAALDITATLIHTPDLRREANPIARALLDSGHALPFVFGYAFVGQGLYVLLLCVLWAGLLRHRADLALSLRAYPSPLLFVKAATGGAELTWRQWLLPLRMSELPRSYYALWTIAVIMLAGVADRWFLGLEWFGLVPHVRVFVVVVAIAIGLACYLRWLWYASRAAMGVSPGTNPDEAAL